MLYTALLRTLFRTVYGEPRDHPGGAEAGLVIVADGVGGLDLCGMGLRSVVGSGVKPYGVHVVHWGHGLGRWYADLSRTDRHASQAELIADEVASRREQSPGLPVFLVGKSGGTGLVVRALERLPADSVEAVVLLAPALSPRYDLTRALRAVRGRMVVFWSPFDLIVLGAGTCLFGTIDRRHSVSAGLVGFRPPAVGDEETDRQYRKLRQERWQPSMMRTGYFGGHVGPDSPAFLRRYVLPILTDNAGDPPGKSGRGQDAPRERR